MSLDPRLNLAAKKALERQRDQPPKLNPPFPWRARALDVEFFGLDVDPPEPPQKKPGGA